MCERHIYEESYIYIYMPICVIENNSVYMWKTYIYDMLICIGKKGDKGFLGGNKKNILSNYKIHKLLFQSL